MSRNQVYQNDLKQAITHVPHVEKLRGKRIAIFGATGLIGSFLADCLLAANEWMDLQVTVIAIGRTLESLKRRFGEETNRLFFMQADVTSFAWDKNCDYMIHAASYGHPEAFLEQPVEVMNSNYIGTKNILEYAKKNDCRVLFVSSGEVYGGVDHMLVRSCYPVSKIAAETLCLSYMYEYSVNVVIARLCHTFGPTMTKNDNRAATHFLKLAAEQKDIVLNSLGTHRRSFSYVADCVSGLLTILLLGETGQAYDIASDDVKSIREFADICADCGGVCVQLREADEKEKKELSPIPNQIMDNANLKKLGWNPIYSVEQGIANTIDILRGAD